jgi:hypothetical protein
MVGLTKKTNPFDGVGDGVIKGAVVAVELMVRLAAVVDEAVTPLNRLACCAATSNGSRRLHISPILLNIMAQRRVQGAITLGIL